MAKSDRPVWEGTSDERSRQEMRVAHLASALALWCLVYGAFAGRRGGGFSTSGSFNMMVQGGNRAGNDERDLELGEGHPYLCGWR